MKANEVLEELRISRPTLSKYVKQGLIKIEKTINGHHIYNDESVHRLSGTAVASDSENKETDSLTKEECIIEALENCSYIFGYIEAIGLLKYQPAIDARQRLSKLIKDLKDK